MQKDTGYNQYVFHLPEYMDDLAGLGTLMFVPQGTHFVQTGKYASECFVVKSGKVISYEAYSGGKTRNGPIMTEGAIIGDAFLLLDEPYPFDFKTIEDCELIRISKESLLTYLELHPRLYRILLASISQKYVSTIAELRHVLGCSATYRVCHLLHSFAQYYGVPTEEGILIDLDLSQQKIAWFLCLDRITVVRVFKKLSQLNLIERQGARYHIKSLPAFLSYMDEIQYDS